VDVLRAILWFAMPRIALQGDDKFAPFSISTHTYKMVDGHPILADVFIPKSLLDLDRASTERSKKRPLMIRIHGGALVGGQRDHAVWCTGWLLSLAIEHNAIIVAPDYRVMPESTVLDLLDDLEDFMIWVEKELPSVIRNTTKLDDKQCLDIDLGRTLIAGDSAGGYCAIQMALSHFNASSSVNIRALVAIYPMLNLRAPHWTQPYAKQLMGIPQFPASVIDDHLAAIRALPAKPVVSNALMPGTPRGILGIALIQHGRMGEFYGVDAEELDTAGSRRLHPEDRIKEGAKLPPTLIVHGKNDTLVPVKFTDEFVELARKLNAFVVSGDESHNAWKASQKVEGGLMYAKVDGEHGFDFDLDPEKELWIKDGLDFIQEVWLA